MRWGFALALITVLGYAAVGTIAFGVSELPEQATTALIPPGREASTINWLRPFAQRGFASHRPHGYAIEKSEIRIQLGAPDGLPCDGPEWVKSPGTAVVTRAAGSPLGDAPRRGAVSSGETQLSWLLCDAEARVSVSEAEVLVRELDESYAGDIWVPVPADPARRGTGMVAGVSRLPANLLAVAWLGLAACLSVVVAWLVAAKERPGAGSPARAARAARATPVSLIGWSFIAAGAASRVFAASTTKLDGDEASWALPRAASDALSIFASDHDALIHPPLFRAVQHGWADFIGWSVDSPVWLLRVPALVASIVTLALVVSVVAQASTTRWRWLPLLVIALQPDLVDGSILARPYALSALFVSVVIYCTWVERTTAGLVTSARWALAMFAAVLAGWTDLLAGLAALGVLAIACVQPRLRVVRLISLAVVVAGCALLLPGAVEAAITGVAPDGIGPQPNLSPNIAGFGRGSLATSLTLLASFAVFATKSVGLGALAWGFLLVGAALGLRSGQRQLLWPILGITALAFIDTFLVGLRPRNVIFLPYGTAVALAMCADPLVSWVQQLKWLRRAESA